MRMIVGLRPMTGMVVVVRTVFFGMLVIVGMHVVGMVVGVRMLVDMRVAVGVGMCVAVNLAAVLVLVRVGMIVFVIMLVLMGVFAFHLTLLLSVASCLRFSELSFPRKSLSFPSCRRGTASGPTNACHMQEIPAFAGITI